MPATLLQSCFGFLGRWTTSADKATVKSTEAGDRSGGQAFGSGRVNQVGTEPHSDIVSAEFAD